MKAEGEGARKEKVMLLFELPVALSILFTREGGGSRWVIGKSQGLSFCHVVSFLISWLIFHWRLVPFTPI